MSVTVLVVEDEDDIRDLVEMNLRRAGFQVLPARDGAEALSLAQAHQPPVVLLDLMLPDMSGTDICAALRADPALASTYVIMVTARTEENDRITGFEVGADDYVTKPFSVKELVLRVQAAARRVVVVPPSGDGELRYGELCIDPVAHRAWKGSEELVLTATEYRLLCYLAEHSGEMCSRGTLLVDVWELPANLNTRTVDTHIKRLRQKLGDHADLIETVRGAGYRFNGDAF